MDLSNHIKVPTQLFLDAVKYKILNNRDCDEIFLNLKNSIDSYKTINIVPNINDSNSIVHFWTSVFTPYWNNEVFNKNRKLKRIFPISDMIVDAGILPVDRARMYEFEYKPDNMKL